MLIRSSFQENQYYYFQLRTTFDSSLVKVQTKRIRTDNELCLANCEISYNDYICVVHSSIHSKQTMTEIVEVEGEYVKIVYLRNGNPTIHKNIGQSIVNHPKFTIKYCNNTIDEFKMESDSSTEVSMIYFTRPFFIYLLQKEDWSSKNDFFLKILTRQFCLQSFPLQEDLCMIFKSIKKSTIYNPEQDNYFIGLKIREFLFKIHQLDYNRRANFIAKDFNFKKIEKISIVKQYIDSHYIDTPTLKQLAQLSELNELYLRQCFKQAYGKTIRAYIIELKMKKALVLVNEYPVNEITEILGYRSSSHFITTFKNYYGCTPAKMKGKSGC